MPRLSTETRNCVVDLYNDGMHISAIKERLEEEEEEEEEEGSVISGGTEYPLCTCSL